MSFRQAPLTHIFLSMALSVVVATQPVLASVSESQVWDARRQALKNSMLASIRQQNLVPHVQRFKLGDARLGSSSSETSASIQHLKRLISPLAATVREMYSGDLKKPPVVIIEDIHLHEEAQMNIASVLEALNKAHPEFVLGVEGASGPFDFVAFRGFSNPTLSYALTRSFLKKNLLAAPSFHGITSRQMPFSTFGIDNSDLHKRNIESYRRATQNQISANEEWERQHRKADQKIAKILNPRFQALDQFSRVQMSSINNGEKIIEGMKTLSSWDPKVVPASVKQFLTACELEGKLDFPAVQKEREQVMRVLAQKLSVAETQTLVDASRDFSTGKMGFASYFEFLKTVMAHHGVDLNRYSQFRRYVDYALMADALNMDLLYSDLSSWQGALLKSIPLSDAERHNVETAWNLRLVHKLLRFELSSLEWANVKRVWPSLPASLSSQLVWHRTFYELADERSRAMVGNLLSLNSSQGSVLIVGGFHRADVTRQLRDQRIGYLVVSPRVTQVDPETPSYLSVFSQEKSPLERLFSEQTLFVNPPHLAVGSKNPEAASGQSAWFSVMAALSFGAGVLGMSQMKAAGISQVKSGPSAGIIDVTLSGTTEQKVSIALDSVPSGRAVVEQFDVDGRRVAILNHQPTSDWRTWLLGVAGAPLGVFVRLFSSDSFRTQLLALPRRAMTKDNFSTLELSPFFLSAINLSDQVWMVLQDELEFAVHVEEGRQAFILVEKRNPHNYLCFVREGANCRAFDTFGFVASGSSSNFESGDFVLNSFLTEMVQWSGWKSFGDYPRSLSIVRTSDTGGTSITLRQKKSAWMKSVEFFDGTHDDPELEYEWFAPIELTVNANKREIATIIRPAGGGAVFIDGIGNRFDSSLPIYQLRGNVDLESLAVMLAATPGGRYIVSDRFKERFESRLNGTRRRYSVQETGLRRPVPIRENGQVRWEIRELYQITEVAQKDHLAQQSPVSQVSAPGGRWPFLQKFYALFGSGFVGQTLWPTIIESGLFVSGFSLAVLYSSQTGLSNSIVLGVVAFWLLMWHVFHGDTAFTSEKLKISFSTLLLLGIFAQVSALPLALSIVVASTIPHLIVNHFWNVVEVINPDRVSTFQLRHGIAFFDFDGTLWQGFPRYEVARFYADLISDNNSNPADIETAFHFIRERSGQSSKHILSVWLSEHGRSTENIDQIQMGLRSRLVNAISAKRLGRPRFLTKGVHGLLNRLGFYGMRFFVLTGGSGALRYEVAKELGLSGHFRRDEVLGKGDKAKNMREILATHSLGPDRAFLVGDSIVDMQQAREAGVLAVGFAATHADRDSLVSAGADVVIYQNFLNNPLILSALGLEPRDGRALVSRLLSLWSTLRGRMALALNQFPAVQLFSGYKEWMFSLLPAFLNGDVFSSATGILFSAFPPLTTGQPKAETKIDPNKINKFDTLVELLGWPKNRAKPVAFEVQRIREALKKQGRSVGITLPEQLDPVRSLKNGNQPLLTEKEFQSFIGVLEFPVVSSRREAFSVRGVTMSPGDIRGYQPHIDQLLSSVPETERVVLVLETDGIAMPESRRFFAADRYPDHEAVLSPVRTAHVELGNAIRTIESDLSNIGTSAWLKLLRGLSKGLSTEDLLSIINKPRAIAQLRRFYKPYFVPDVSLGGPIELGAANDVEPHVPLSPDSSEQSESPVASLDSDQLGIGLSAGSVAIIEYLATKYPHRKIEIRLEPQSVDGIVAYNRAKTQHNMALRSLHKGRFEDYLEYAARAVEAFRLRDDERNRLFSTHVVPDSLGGKGGVVLFCSDLAKPAQVQGPVSMTDRQVYEKDDAMSFSVRLVRDWDLSKSPHQQSSSIRLLLLGHLVDMTLVPVREPSSAQEPWFSAMTALTRACGVERLAKFFASAQTLESSGDDIRDRVLQLLGWMKGLHDSKVDAALFKLNTLLVPQFKSAPELKLPHSGPVSAQAERFRKILTAHPMPISFLLGPVHSTEDFLERRPDFERVLDQASGPLTFFLVGEELNFKNSHLEEYLSPDPKVQATLLERARAESSQLELELMSLQEAVRSGRYTWADLIDMAIGDPETKARFTAGELDEARKYVELFNSVLATTQNSFFSLELLKFISKRIRAGQLINFEFESAPAENWILQAQGMAARHQAQVRFDNGDMQGYLQFRKMANNAFCDFKNKKRKNVVESVLPRLKVNSGSPIVVLGPADAVETVEVPSISTSLEFDMLNHWTIGQEWTPDLTERALRTGLRQQLTMLMSPKSDIEQWEVAVQAVAEAVPAELLSLLGSVIQGRDKHVSTEQALVGWLAQSENASLQTAVVSLLDLLESDRHPLAGELRGILGVPDAQRDAQDPLTNLRTWVKSFTRSGLLSHLERYLESRCEPTDPLQTEKEAQFLVEFSNAARNRGRLLDALLMISDVARDVDVLPAPLQVDVILLKAKLLFEIGYRKQAIALVCDHSASTGMFQVKPMFKQNEAAVIFIAKALRSAGQMESARYVHDSLPEGLAKQALNAQSRFYDGEIKQALADVSSLSTSPIDSPELVLFVAQLLSDLGEHNLAIARLSETGQPVPVASLQDDVAVWVELARQYELLGGVDMGIHVLTGARDRFRLRPALAQFAAARAQLARLFLKKGDFVRASQLLTGGPQSAILSTFEQYPMAYVLYADLLSIQGNVDEAFKFWTSSMDKAVFDSQVLSDYEVMPDVPKQNPSASIYWAQFLSRQNRVELLRDRALFSDSRRNSPHPDLGYFVEWAAIASDKNLERKDLGSAYRVLENEHGNGHGDVGRLKPSLRMSVQAILQMAKLDLVHRGRIDWSLVSPDDGKTPYSHLRYNPDVLLLMAGQLIQEGRVQDAHSLLVDRHQKLKAVLRREPFAQLYLAEVYAQLDQRDQAWAVMNLLETNPARFETNGKLQEQVATLKDRLSTPRQSPDRENSSPHPGSDVDALPTIEDHVRDVESLLPILAQRHPNAESLSALAKKLGDLVRLNPHVEVDGDAAQNQLAYVESLLKRQAGSSVSGGRWPFLESLYQLAGPGFWGFVALPTIVESVGFVSGVLNGVLMLGNVQSFYGVFGVAALTLFSWQLLHVDKSFSVDKNLISASSLFLLAGLLNFSSLPVYLAILVAVTVPHLIVNGWLLLFKSQTLRFELNEILSSTRPTAQIESDLVEALSRMPLDLGVRSVFDSPKASRTMRVHAYSEAFRQTLKNSSDHDLLERCCYKLRMLLTGEDKKLFAGSFESWRTLHRSLVAPTLVVRVFSSSVDEKTLIRQSKVLLKRRLSHQTVLLVVPSIQAKDAIESHFGQGAVSVVVRTDASSLGSLWSSATGPAAQIKNRSGVSIDVLIDQDVRLGAGFLNGFSELQYRIYVLLEGLNPLMLEVRQNQLEQLSRLISLIRSHA